MKENCHWWKIINDGWFEFYSCKQCGVNFKLTLNTDDKDMPLECPYCGFQDNFIKEKEPMEKDYKYYIDLCKKQDYERVFPNIEEMNNSKDFYKENGFHYEDIWNLDRTIIKFILPRLAYFRDNHDGIPNEIYTEMELDTTNFTSEDWARHDDEAEKLWIDKINKILNGFEIYLTRYWYDRTEEDKKYIEDAWELFRKYFGSFWN